MATTLLSTSNNPFWAALRERDFRLLWLGQLTSMIGDHFHGIASAWLVLKLTGDPLALGTVLALGGIPRAIFTLVGGAITDRYSPRQVMLVTDVVRLAIAVLVATQIFTNTLEVWMIYIYSLVAGCVGGLFGPASMSIVPHLLPEKDLQAGNSLSQGSAQLVGFLGPAAAGAFIAAFTNERLGLGMAAAIDAFTFVISLATLALMRPIKRQVTATGDGRPTDVWAAIQGGFGYMFNDPGLRLMLIVVAIANLSLGGPLLVGIPYLAETRLSEGAAAYGFIIAGYAGGNLLGIVLAGLLPAMSRRLFRILSVMMFAVFGLGILALGWVTQTGWAVADLFVMGVLNGYLSIIMITGLQRNTASHMLGRLMSFILFANFALVPLSQVITGAVMRWNIAAMFVLAGVLLLGLATYLMMPKASDPLLANLVYSDTQDHAVVTEG
jgi:hypothetical protein